MTRFNASETLLDNTVGGKRTTVERGKLNNKNAIKKTGVDRAEINAHKAIAAAFASNAPVPEVLYDNVAKGVLIMENRGAPLFDFIRKTERKGSKVAMVEAMYANAMAIMSDIHDRGGHAHGNLHIDNIVVKWPINSKGPKVSIIDFGRAVPEVTRKNGVDFATPGYRNTRAYDNRTMKKGGLPGYADLIALAKALDDAGRNAPANLTEKEKENELRRLVEEGAKKGASNRTPNRTPNNNRTPAGTPNNNRTPAGTPNNNRTPNNKRANGPPAAPRKGR